MGFIRNLCLVCLAFVASACLPVTTTAPVGSTTAMTPDPALVGMWKGRPPNEKEDLYFTFFPQADGTISVVDVEPKGKDAGWGAFSLKAAALGEYHYMNVHEISTNGKAEEDATAQKSFPVLYKVNGDGALVVYLMDEKRAEAAIKANKIAGTVETGQFGDVSITASASDLDAFMATADARALFDKPLLILRKVK